MSCCGAICKMLHDHHSFYRSNNIPAFQYVFSVASIEPDIGSVYGGTLVTITGAGFGTGGETLSAAFGNRGCTIQDPVVDTSLTCLIEEIRDTYTVTNKGEHPGLKQFIVLFLNEIPCQNFLDNCIIDAKEVVFLNLTIDSFI